MNREELLNVATEAGSLLLRSGAEIYRVEESMHRIFEAYGVHDGDVFAIPSCIYVTVNTRRARLLRALRAFSTARRTWTASIARTTSAAVSAASSRPMTRRWRCSARCGAVLSTACPRSCWPARSSVFSFASFFGGSLLDSVWAAVGSVAMRLLLAWLERWRVNAFFCNLMGGAVLGFVTVAAVSLGFSVSTDKIIIGALMNLVPGIVITTFMRDMMAGDVVAGLIRFPRACLSPRRLRSAWACR